VVGDLLMQHVPLLASGDLQIVAIARRPTVLSKVAVRRSPNAQVQGRPVPLVLGVGADHIRRVRDALGGERVDVVQWQREPTHYIAAALGLSYLPSMLLLPGARLAQVFLVVFDLEQVVPPVLDDVRAGGPLSEQRVASDQHAGQLELAEQGDGVGQLVLPLADGQLTQHRAASARERAQQVGAR
jgi:N utilization substance protein A